MNFKIIIKLKYIIKILVNCYLKEHINKMIKMKIYLMEHIIQMKLF